MIELSEVHEKVCNYFNVDYLFPFERSRKKEHVYVRQIFHYVARETTNKKMVTFEKIGNYLSDIIDPFNHATVLNSYIKIKGYLTYDKKVNEDVNNIIKSLNSYSNK